jgi:putative pyruvate formate lyase activating enzyme
MSEPSYLRLHRTGKLGERARRLYGMLEPCCLCPRKCMARRLGGELGYCRSGMGLRISSFGPHFGEEPEITGIRGSGTIFMAGCNLLCVYCQNFEISHMGRGKDVPPGKAAEMMLVLQREGCHNINLVTPTHFAPQLVEAIAIAAGDGLRIPIFWNCGGYESVEALRLLEGVVDIYKVDMKYSDPAPAGKYSGAPDYWERCKEAVREMHRQVGDLRTGPDGIACRGLLVRHLVLPNQLAGSERVLGFVAGLSKGSYVNIMDQYRPCGRAHEHKELARGVTRAEHSKAVDCARNLGLRQP